MFRFVFPFGSHLRIYISISNCCSSCYTCCGISKYKVESRKEVIFFRDFHLSLTRDDSYAVNVNVVQGGVSSQYSKMVDNLYRGRENGISCENCLVLMSFD